MEEQKPKNWNDNQIIVFFPNNENLGPALLPQNHTNYLNSFPSGYRFNPTDQELIADYLQPKINNLPLPPNQIHHVDIYKESPDTLTARFVKANEREWYFFSPRDKKYKNGSRPKRAAGDGYWKATCADKNIRDKSKQVIGLFKTLVYYKGLPQKGHKQNWIMKEYRVVDGYSVRAAAPSSSSAHNSMQLDDCVLYKVYQKPPAARKDSKDKSSFSDKEVNEDQPANPTQAKHEDQLADLIEPNYENQPVSEQHYYEDDQIIYNGVQQQQHHQDQPADLIEPSYENQPVSEQHYYEGDQIFYNDVQQQQHHQVQPANQIQLFYQDNPADQVLEQHYRGDQKFNNGAHHQQYEEQHQQLWSTPPNENISNNIVMYQHNNVMLSSHMEIDREYLTNPIPYIENRDWLFEDLPDLRIDYPTTRGGGDDLSNHQYLQPPFSSFNWNPPAPQMQQQQHQERLNITPSTSNPTNDHPSPPESVLKK